MCPPPQAGEGTLTYAAYSSPYTSMKHAVRDRVPAFELAERKELRERIDMRSGDVGVCGEIAERIEIRGRIAAFLEAGLVVLVERIDVRGRDVGVVRQVAGGVEERIRVAALFPADRLEVEKRVDARGRDIGIVLQIVHIVEAVRGEQHVRRKGLAPLTRAG